MSEGNGYQVFLNGVDTLFYPAESFQKKTERYFNKPLENKHFIVNSRSGFSQSVIIDNIDFDEISIGDEIGLFAKSITDNSELLVGSAVYNNSFPMGFSAWQDDEQTEVEDGFVNEDKMIIRIWDLENNIEINAENIEFSGSDRFNSEAPYLWINNITVNSARKEIVPEKYDLFGNYPNPFNPTTTIFFRLSERSKVVLEIFNIKGQKIRTLLNEDRSKGEHRIIWDGKDNNGKKVVSGIYSYRIKSKNINVTRKMVLIK